MWVLVMEAGFELSLLRSHYPERASALEFKDATARNLIIAM